MKSAKKNAKCKMKDATDHRFCTFSTRGQSAQRKRRLAAAVFDLPAGEMEFVLQLATLTGGAAPHSDFKGSWVVRPPRSDSLVKIRCALPTLHESLVSCLIDARPQLSVIDHSEMEWHDGSWPSHQPGMD